MVTSLPSRGLRAYAGGFLAGGISAAFFAVAVQHAGTIFIFLACLSALPLFIASLGAGIPVSIVSTGVALGALTFTRPLNFVLLYFALYGLPAIVLTILALRRRETNDHKTSWYAEGDLVTAIALYPCLAFVAAMAATIPQGGLLALTTQGMLDGLEPFKASVDPGTFAQATVVAKTFARMLPLLLGCSWMFLILLSMYVSQVTLRQQNWNLRPDFEIQNIYVPKWLLILVVMGALAGGFAPAPYDYLGTNIAVMLCVPFFFAGLAVVHAYADTTIFRGWILALYYILLAIPFALTLVPAYTVTMLLGITDQWANIRQRLAARPKPRR